MSPTQSILDPDELKAFSLRVWGYKKGEMVSLMIHLGDRLGLYQAMDGAGPLSSAELASRTGLQERWLREWMRGQAAAELLDYHAAKSADADEEDGRFELSAYGAAVLADEKDSLAFASGAFTGGTPPDISEKLADAFRTGIGLSYEEMGPNAAHRTERMLGTWIRLALVPQIIPALDGVHEKLAAGAVVADVGCGSGLALIAMAEAYPKSTFVGYDPNSHGIERGRQHVADKGLENVELRVAGGEELPEEPRYDFLLTFDCIHDMPHPSRVINAIRRAIQPDGTWLIKDIRSKPRFEDNLGHPMLAMLYGFSVSACMSSALSEPDGAGLGTLGFNPEVAEKMVREAGFSQFKEHDFHDPANLYYEIRP